LILNDGQVYYQFESRNEEKIRCGKIGAKFSRFFRSGVARCGILGQILIFNDCENSYLPSALSQKREKNWEIGIKILSKMQHFSAFIIWVRPEVGLQAGF
jgi:hypothetical protein